MGSPPRSRKASLWTVLSIVVLDLIGFGIVIPILPFYAEAYGASATVLGLLLTSFAAMQFFFAPVWGRLSDRIGRRPVILFTIAGTSLTLLILGLAGSLFWLFVARILGGVFGANISVATAYITDQTEEHERTRWMGLIGASFGVGFILGPAIGGLLAPWGYHVPLLVAAALAAINCLYAAYTLQEPPRRESTREAEGESVPLGGLVRRLCGLNFLFTFGVTQLETVFAFFMLHRFGYDAREVAWILVLMAVIMAGVQGGAIRSLAQRFGERRLLLFGSLLLGACCAAVPFSPTVPLLLIPLALSSLGRGVAQPSMLSLVSQGAAENRRGAVMGAYQSAASLARVLSPLAAGALYDLDVAYPFLLAGGLLATVFLIGLTMRFRGVQKAVEAEG